MSETKRDKEVKESIYVLIYDSESGKERKKYFDSIEKTEIEFHKLFKRRCETVAMRIIDDKIIGQIYPELKKKIYKWHWWFEANVD